MTKKVIIETLKTMGFKANYTNVLCAGFDDLGYLIVKQKTNMYKVTKDMLNTKTNIKDIKII